MKAITIADDEWERLDEKDPSRLHANLLVNGVHVHLEAWPVRMDESRGYPVQDYLGPFPEAFHALECIHDVDETYATVTIRGQQYVLVAFPAAE
ncbi:MAG TPA: hypothetical protein VKP64_00855 [Mycobacteriales bacterium]|nr:hypothetical protein [Mycobacteriales bacterium]